jgi:Holliday junction resolvase RusA-like endonuclease
LRRLDFFVAGVPVAQGSKRHVGGGKMIESSKSLAPWRATIVSEAVKANPGKLRIVGPVHLGLTFYFPRPASHYGTGRNAGKLKSSALIYKTSRPDIEKLCRAVCDALVQSGALQDDSLVVILHAKKIYDHPHGVRVIVSDAL